MAEGYMDNNVDFSAVQNVADDLASQTDDLHKAYSNGTLEV